MKLSELFSDCLGASYVHTEYGGDYALKKRNRTLYIYLEASDGAEDWRSNLAFFAKAYSREGHTVFRAHRGFLRVWEAMLPAIAQALEDPNIKNAVTVGYSHGGALAVLCHEYIWYRRRDLRSTLLGYGFGAPRVLWGRLSPMLEARWEGFTVLRNLDDAVTHLPFAALGYRHVGTLLEIGEKNKYSAIDAHRAENILAELKRYEKERRLKEISRFL